MRRYLATIHKRSDQHKKNFALGVSGIITLLIFAIWLFVNYGTPTTVAEDGAKFETASAQEVSPLGSLGQSLSSSWESLWQKWGELNTGYQDLKEKTFDTYGR